MPFEFDASEYLYKLTTCIELHRVFLMETSNYPQTYPDFQYFPPPTGWIDPNFVSSDDDDNNTPTWIIVGIVIVVAILGGFLFYYYIRMREKKIKEKAACVSASAPKSVAPQPATATKTATPKKEDTAKKDTTTTPKKEEKTAPPKPPPMGFPISFPGDCPSCGQRGGLYSFSYTCPLCKYKMECNVQYPQKK